MSFVGNLLNFTRKLYEGERGRFWTFITFSISILGLIVLAYNVFAQDVFGISLIAFSSGMAGFGFLFLGVGAISVSKLSLAKALWLGGYGLLVLSFLSSFLGLV